MELKRVTFKVAKALKEAGYPQDITNSHYTHWGELVYYGIAGETGFDAPTYLDVWLWLWREKNIKMPIGHHKETFIVADEINMIEFYSKNDPEEVIIGGHKISC